MRLALTTLGLGLALGTIGGAVGMSLARAQLLDTFTLERHDTILTEAQGCSASCRVIGDRRICTLKSLDCKAVCRTLPECKPDGRPMQVCAVIRVEPR